jgi:hypothetical protein
LSESQLDLTREWQQLCEWFKSKAAEAVSRTTNAQSRESILCTVLTFCRDEPPKTIEGFNAFKRFAEGHAGLWDSARLSDSTEVPLVDRTESGKPPAR